MSVPSSEDASGPIVWIDRQVPLTAIDGDRIAGPPPGRALIASVAASGVMSPVLLASPDGEPLYAVIDGGRRISAARMAGLAEVPARITAIDGESRATLTLIANEQRARNPVAELRAIAALEEAGYGESEIARRSGMPVQTVRKRMRIRQLIPDLYASFERGELPAALAEELAKVPEGEQAAISQRWVDGERLTHSLMQDARSARRSAALRRLVPQIDAQARADVRAVPSLAETVRELHELLTHLPADRAIEADRALGRLASLLQARLR